MRTHAVVLVIIMSAVTILLRFLPFLIWSGGKKTPSYILYLGKVLPGAIIGMLVVYCLKDISFTSAADFVPELIASVCVVALQVRGRNSLVSILGGTVFYMFLVQMVF